MFKSINNGLLQLYTFSIVFEFWDIFGLEGTFSINLIIGILYFISSLPYLKKRLSFRYFPITFRAILIFFFFFSLSSLVNFEYVTSFSSIVSTRILSNILFLIIVSNHLISEPELIFTTLLMFCFSVAVMGVLFLMGIGIAEDAIDKRISLFNENPNSFGFKALLGYSISLFFIFQKRHKSVLFLAIFIGTIPLFFSMIIASASRSALILFVFSTILSIYFWKKKIRYKIALFALVFGIGFYVVSYVLQVDSLMYARLLNTVDSKDVGGRDELFMNSLSQIPNHLFFGVSRIPLSTTEIYRDPLNVYLAVLLASGILGFLPFLYFNYKILKYAYISNKESKLFILIVLMILINFDMFQNGGNVNPKKIWYMYSLTLGGYYAFKINNSNKYF